mmetsp:Transcript_13587/g.38643  ORF Transcript_13587/g.38643 Transcript_13587/m.38643 type:complete len:382 (+) Transcript_13587:40-1185(+)
MCYLWPTQEPQLSCKRSMAVDASAGSCDMDSGQLCVAWDRRVASRRADTRPSAGRLAAGKPGCWARCLGFLDGRGAASALAASRGSLSCERSQPEAWAGACKSFGVHEGVALRRPWGLAGARQLAAWGQGAGSCVLPPHLAAGMAAQALQGFGLSGSSRGSLSSSARVGVLALSKGEELAGAFVACRRNVWWRPSMLKVGPARPQELRAFALRTGTGFDLHLALDLRLRGCGVMLRYAFENCQYRNDPEQQKSFYVGCSQAGSLRLRPAHDAPPVELAAWAGDGGGVLLWRRGSAAGLQQLSMALFPGEPALSIADMLEFLRLALGGPLAVVEVPDARSGSGMPAAQLLERTLLEVFEEHLRPESPSQQEARRAALAAAGG